MSEMLVTQKRSLEKQFLQQHLESNQLFRALYENHPDAVYALDLEGNFLSGNLVCEKISGYMQEEICMLPAHCLFVPEDLDKVVNGFKRAAVGGEHECTATILHKQGFRVPVQMKHFPIRMADKLVGVFGVAREIWGKRHRFVVENSTEMICRFSMNGICLYASPSCRTMLGYEPEEMIGRPLRSIAHRQDRKALLHLRRSLMQDEKPLTFINRFQTKSGEFKWFETTCRSFPCKDQCGKEVISISRDITQHKQMEETLSGWEERYRNMVENSRDPIIILQEDRLVYANKAGLELLGGTRKEEMIGRNVFDFVHPAFHRIVEEQLRKVKQGSEVGMIEQKFIRLDGKVIDVEAKGFVTFYQNEPAVQVVVRDITEQKKTQELLQNSEKLTLVGQLAAGIAHEIRNPLTALKGFLQLIQQNSKENKEYFSIMLSELTRIELIVSELLVLAKPHSTFFQPRNLYTLIKHVVTLLDTEAIMKSVQINTEFDPHIPLINCDENQLKQAFINFLKNGIEAMPQGGEILIRVKRENDRVLILFTDNGFGIPKERISRLGEPFFTTKEAGTGLGLMVSNKIIQNHLGSIQLTSEPGVGTTVTVTLPIQSDEQQPAGLA